MSDRTKRIQAALGKIDCDLIFRGVSYLDVFSCEFRTGDVAVYDGFVVGLEEGLKATREIDAKGKWLVPGFIDAHVHIESSMMLPGSFERATLERGTTAAICDPHEIANVSGHAGLKYFVDYAENAMSDLWMMASSCVPATHLETNGAGALLVDDLVRYRDSKRVLGLAEMMNVPGVLNGDPVYMDKIDAFAETNLDGHCPLLRGKELSAYASVGINSCHESTELAEAAEKLSKGMAVWIREGSVAKDLDELIPLLNEKTSTSLGFCTDDRNPFDIAKEGHIDFLIREAIKRGVAPELCFRTASWSVARHYGLDRGVNRCGAIAPGYQADLVLLDDLKSVRVSQVFKRGIGVDELEFRLLDGNSIRDTVRADVPELAELQGPTGQVRTIGVEHGKLLTDSLVCSHDEPGVCRLSVLERYGKGGSPSHGFAKGFGESFNGAIGSSVGHDSHNLIVASSDATSMRTAFAALINEGGGFVVTRGDQVLAKIALPYGGLMSDETPETLSKLIAVLKDASKSVGCVLPEPFLQLAFLSLPVIPSLKLTDKGLVDVNQFDFVSVAV